MFKIYFKNEMKRLGFKLGDICDLLDMSRPTLNTRLEKGKGTGIQSSFRHVSKAVGDAFNRTFAQT